MVVGVWRSWLARSVRDAEVGGSSPLTPTMLKVAAVLLGQPFLIIQQIASQGALHWVHEKDPADTVRNRFFGRNGCYI